MKKFLCVLLCFLAILCSFTVSYAVVDDTKLWQDEYFNIINITKVSADTHFVLVDTDYDEIPELFCGDNRFVTAFSIKNNSLVKLYEIHNVPIEYIGNMKAYFNPASSMTEFAGQCMNGNAIVSYRLIFGENGITCETIENERNYFRLSQLMPLTISVMDSEEIKEFEKISDASSSFTSRHTFLASLSDDTAKFNFSEREKIKDAISDGDFLCFEKISYLNENDIFVQFYKAYDKSDFLTPVSKSFALITEGENGSVTIYEEEKDIDSISISQNEFLDFVVSNVYIDYGKVSGILNFDEHLSYLNNLVSEFGSSANNNAKKEILNYIEYAVNKSSRTQLKSKKNVYAIDSTSVSLVSEYAVNCMERMLAVCKPNGIEFEDNLTLVPEIVLSGVDLTKPVRVEFKSGISKSLNDVSGLKVMLDSHHGIYLTAETLSYFEENTDAFCIEIKHSQGKISVCFADRNNNLMKTLEKPISFILPAKSRFSSVMRTTKEGTKIIGGEYNPLFKTVAFKTKISGTYSVVENDFTINDVQKLSEKQQEAVHFAVSSGAMSLKNNKFEPKKNFSRGEFITALIKLFYEVNSEATVTFSDISEDSEIYPFVASAEELGLTSLFEGTEFNEDLQITRQTAVALLGRTLVKSGKFSYPEKTDEDLLFSDSSKISHLAISDISVALDAGIIDATKYFSPDKKLTKSEVSRLLYNAYMALFEDSEITTTTSIKKEAPKDAPEEKTDWELFAALIIFAGIFVLFIGYIIRKIVKRRKAKNTNTLSRKEDNSGQD